MAKSNSTAALVHIPPDTSVIPYSTEVPGNLEWFDRSRSEYVEWYEQLERFLDDINPEKPGGKLILDDVLDSILKSEMPTGIVSGLLTTFRVTQSARRVYKRREIWNKVVAQTLQLTFTSPIHKDLEFRFTFYQIEQVWQSVDLSEPFLPEDYKKLYSNVSQKFSVGKLRTRIMKFPRLSDYVEYKLRQFKDSFQKFQTNMLGY